MNIKLTINEYRIVRECLGFLDQNPNICKNVECSESEWNNILEKFGCGVPEELQGIANVKNPA